MTEMPFAVCCKDCSGAEGRLCVGACRILVWCSHAFAVAVLLDTCGRRHGSVQLVRMCFLGFPTPAMVVGVLLCRVRMCSCMLWRAVMVQWQQLR